MVHVYDLQGGQWVTGFQAAAGIYFWISVYEDIYIAYMLFLCATAYVIFIYLILDTVNGFSFHPYLPLATTSSGHRRFGMEDESEEESSLSGLWMSYTQADF